MLKFKQELAHKVEELTFGTAPHRKVNVRSTANPNSGERAEQENMGTSGVFQYTDGTTDTSLVLLWKLGFSFQCESRHPLLYQPPRTTLDLDLKNAGFIVLQIHTLSEELLLHLSRHPVSVSLNCDRNPASDFHDDPYEFGGLLHVLAHFSHLAVIPTDP